MRTSGSFLLSFLVACASDEFAGDSTGIAAPDDPGREVTLRVNVLPGQVRESNEPDARVRALPQTLFLPPLSAGEGYRLGDVELLVPVIQTGTVRAYRVNPSVASLPGADVPLEGTVRLRLPDTVQSGGARTSELGTFSIWSLPDTSYRLEIVPDDPLLPMFTDWLDVSSSPTRIDLDLGAGVPIYGRVSSAVADGLSGVQIYVVDPYGARSTVAVSDALGLYQIRVAPGTWTVISEGRTSGTDPTLEFANLEVGPTGLNLDIEYPTDLYPSFVRGSVEDEDGNALELATVRLVAETLDGYDANASWSTDVFVSETGFSSPVIPGYYTIEALPPEGAGDDLTPARLTGQRLGPETTTLEPIALGPKVVVTGSVSGPNGLGLASAPVSCREVGFDQRVYRTFTGAQGNFTLDLPLVPVSCEALPPGDRNDLALGRALLDPSQSEAPKIAFVLDSGRRIEGRVVLQGVPEPLVQVEIIDEAGQILGIGLTGEDGTFSVSVSTGPEAADP